MCVCVCASLRVCACVCVCVCRVTFTVFYLYSTWNQGEDLAEIPNIETKESNEGTMREAQYSERRGVLLIHVVLKSPEIGRNPGEDEQKKK